MKICQSCLIEKSIDCFHTYVDKKLNKTYMRNTCKDCKKIYDKSHLTKNKEKHRKNSLNYYMNNKEKIAKQRKEDRKNNNENLKIKIKEKEYRSINKEKINTYKRDYYQNNKDKIRAAQRTAGKKIRQNPQFRIRLNVSRSINQALKKRKNNKNGLSYLNYLLYSISDLKKHLENQFEPWMNWNNYGIYKVDKWNDNDQSTWTWQIDHIIPHSTFKYISMEDENFKKCWSLSNLRPLSSKINILEGVQRTRHGDLSWSS